MVKETTVARLHNEHDREQRDFFERLVLLCETQALNSLHIDHLEYMAHHSTFGHWKASENIASTTDPAETLFIHFDGIFECKSETENLVVNTKGALFPVEVIQSKPFYLTTIRVQTGTALMIPYQTLELCAKLYPEVAIHLFELSNP